MPSASIMIGTKQQPKSDLSGLTTSEYSTTLKHAIQVADDITRRHSASTNWSSWHTWDYIRHNPTPASSAIWKAIHPFATCVGFSTAIAAFLRASYRSTPSLAHLADQVHTMASWELDPSCPEEGERPRHCVAALLTAEACLLVDLVYEPIVMVIPAGGAHETMPYITMSGRLGKRMLHYDGHKLEMANLKRENARRDLFRVIEPDEALRSISTVTSTAIIPGTRIPTNKVVIIRGMVGEPPVRIPSTQLGDRVWMVTTCRLQIDFWKRQLTLQIPIEDWLLKEENSRYHWIWDHAMFRKMSDAVANLVVELPADRADQDVGEALKTLIDVASCLGLPAGEMGRIVDSVYEVWEER